MAARANVAPRTLARRFGEQLGMSPGRWLLAQRLAAARELLEGTDLAVETIATRVGLSSATNLRRRFNHAFRTTPAAYRRVFRELASRPDEDGAVTSERTRHSAALSPILAGTLT
jgi:AraC family transcriptional regulator, transcriptional activator FtrA